MALLLLGGCVTGDDSVAVRPVLAIQNSGGGWGQLASLSRTDAVRVPQMKVIHVPQRPTRAPRFAAVIPPFLGKAVGPLALPVAGAALTSTYGMREHPILGGERVHAGIDLAAPSGTPIMAAADGLVEAAERNGGYGNYVRLRHEGALGTAYAHLSRFGPGISAGTTVRQGQVIGYVGTTGLSTGPHLHWEVLVGGEAVDPFAILPAETRLALRSGERTGVTVAALGGR